MNSFSNSLMLEYVAKWSRYPDLVVGEQLIKEAVLCEQSDESFSSTLRTVNLINGLYAAGVCDVLAMSHHIQLIENLRSRIAQGDHSVVMEIMTYRTGIRHLEKHCYCFATKYCFFHNPNSFPIYDSIVDNVLWTQRQRIGLFAHKRLKDYGFFRDKVDEFISTFGLEHDYEKVDHFLWLRAKERDGQSIWLNNAI